MHNTDQLSKSSIRFAYLSERCKNTQNFPGNTIPVRYKNIFWTTVFLIIFLGNSCNHPQNDKTKVSKVLSQKYTRKFSIQNQGNNLILTTYNSWAGNSIENYLLITDSSTENPEKYSAVIQIPVQRVVCMSTTHVAQIDAIGETQTIVAVSGAGFIYNSKLRQKIDMGQVADIALGSRINLEKLLKLKPDVVFMYGVSMQDLQLAENMRKLGIPVVFNNDYLEQTPLARAEWLIFTAAFYDKIVKARQIFVKECQEYDALKSNSVKNVSVFLNIPFKDIWYMPGGRSYFAQFIKDAGGKYIFEDNTQTKSLTLDFETVYKKAQRTDIWLNAGNANTLEQLRKVDERLAFFDAFRQKKVYNPVKKILPNGANDFWETPVVFPHLILHDLINILSGKTDSLNFYYQQLE